MLYLNENCCICLCNKQLLTRLSVCEDNDISFYIKLTSSVPQMCFEGMNDDFLMCNDCGYILNILFNFRQQCLDVNKYDKMLQQKFEHCCICLINETSVRCLSETEFDGVSIYFKLTLCIPELKCKDISSVNQICMTCYDILNVFYNFIQKCLQNKYILIDYVMKLKSVTKCKSNSEVKSTNEYQDDIFTESKIRKMEYEVDNYDLTHDEKNIESDEKNIESVLKSKIKVETSELKTQQEDSTYEENIRQPFAFVSVNNRNIDNVCEMKIEENKMNRVDVLENEQRRNTNYNITYYDIKSEHANTKIKSEASDRSEDFNGDMHNLDSFGNYDEIKFEEHEMKLEENCLNDQESSNEDNNTSLENKYVNKTGYKNPETKEQEEEFKCSVCCKNLANKGSLKTHMMIHEGSKSYECAVCHKKFSSTRNLKNHMLIHTGDKPHECNICKKKFRHTVTLKSHMVTHTGEKSHECTVCSKKFTLASNLKTHMLLHRDEKPYECKVCNKKFSQQITLRSHMATHSGEKPHECNICNKKFIRTTALNEHMILRSGKKSYECSVCNKKFALGSYLKTHMLVHTEENRHVCNVCKKKFVKPGSLKAHMNIHSDQM